MKVVKVVVCLACFSAFATAPRSGAQDLTRAEQLRKSELRKRLCAARELSCAYVTAVFDDPRLVIYNPPEPQKPPPPQTERERERNPYLRARFGLLTDESMERCRGFIQAHALAFDTAYRNYGVPREIICGILRIESNFGIPTKLSPSPVGTAPAINRLVTLYIRRPLHEGSRHFSKRQRFAVEQLTDLLAAANRFGWDLFEIPGSPTGAIGLAQFEPSSLQTAVDGNDDGTVDLFNPADAILSVAHYLVTRGWDSDPQHEQRAIHAYYGGNYATDRKKYYMRAVLKYADQVGDYLKDHPIESKPSEAF
jgi:membrane-bound lytic murein transglycosylase B